MGKIVIARQPCLDRTECGSSDARAIYENGTSFCFSCHKWFAKSDGEQPIVQKEYHTNKVTAGEIANYPTRGFKERDISKTVAEFFGVKVSYDTEGAIDTHYYPYGGDSFKVRKVPTKDFYWISKSEKLFGQDKFSGKGRRVVITEGEIDAMSIAQASLDRWGKIYPTVSIQSATGLKCLVENREWVRGYDEVVLCLDEDSAGRKALDECIRIIGIDKVKIAKLSPYKDANEVLTKKGFAALNQAVFEAAPFIPSGIITKEELWTALTEYNAIPSHPYPECMEGVNTKLKGMRSGEIVLLVAGTGAGKSSVIREIILHVLNTTKDKIGIVSLEEAPAETARWLSGMSMNRNPANEEIPLEELKVGFDKVFGDDRVILLDHQGAIDDSSILDKLEYMALSGVRYMFIDHITILVSEGSDNLSGNEAVDKVMNGLLRLVKRHPVWLGLVSHLRKVHGGTVSFEEGRMPSIDDVRGSGSIKQISFDIIAFARNMVAEKDFERNTIKVRILKARRTGLTGDVKSMRYVYETGRLASSIAPDGAIEEFVSLDQ